MENVSVISLLRRKRRMGTSCLVQCIILTLEGSQKSSKVYRKFRKIIKLNLRKMICSDIEMAGEGWQAYTIIHYIAMQCIVMHCPVLFDAGMLLHTTAKHSIPQCTASHARDA